MQSVCEPAGASWEAITRYGETGKSLPKAAGLRWNSSLIRWTSTDPMVVVKLRDYADAATQAKRDVDVEAAKVKADVKAQAAAVAVAASPHFSPNQVHRGEESERIVLQSRFLSIR